MNPQALWTIVTPTIGRKSIFRLKEQLAKETVPYVHLIMMDSKRDADSVSPADLEDENTVVYDIRHPLYPEPDARMDVYLRGVGILMARTPYVKCCDDDAWPEVGHLSRAMEFMKSQQLDFTWCLRRMYDREGNVLGVDRFEAVGEKNEFGYNLLDNSSLFCNRQASLVAAQIFIQYPVYGDDRITWDPLHELCAGKGLPEVWMNHMAQPNLVNFFRENCAA